MKIQALENNRYITPKTTGYAAASGIIMTTICGASNNMHLKKLHKPCAYLTAVLTALHIALIEYNHHTRKHK